MTLLVTLVLAANPAAAGEKSIEPSALPAAIQAAVAAGYPGASMTAASTEVEHGAREYEVGIQLGDRSIDLAYTADGTLLEEEEIVALAATPAAVQEKAATYTGWTVKGVERATAKGVTIYEVDLRQGKKRMEVKLDATGAVKGKEHGGNDDAP